MDGVEVECPDCGAIDEGRPGDDCEWCDHGVLKTAEDERADSKENSEATGDVPEDDGSAGSATVDSVTIDGGADRDGDAPDDRPEPPAGVAQYILDGLDRQSPEDLRTIAEYAQRLAAWEANQQATEQEQADADGQDDVVIEREAVDDERRGGVPGKASVVVKEIDGNRYEYWQWWEDGGTKSQYKGPANRKEADQ
jgi:hypothetical protein